MDMWITTYVWLKMLQKKPLKLQVCYNCVTKNISNRSRHKTEEKVKKIDKLYNRIVRREYGKIYLEC